MMPTNFILDLAMIIVMVMGIGAVAQVGRIIDRKAQVMRECLDRLRDTIHDKEIKVGKSED